MEKEGVASDFGKKAQSTTFIILLVVGVVAAVIVLLAVRGTFNPVQEIPGALPGTLTVAAQACDFAVNQGDELGYCGDFKEVEIAGKKQFVNCAYIHETYGLDDNLECGVGSDGKSNSKARDNKYVKAFCDQLDDKGKLERDRMDVNGELCSVTCESLGGEPSAVIAGGEECPGGDANKLEGADNLEKDQICCKKLP